ncbi:MAG TPA: SRPBCC family protein [Gemmataceae bacterium]|jgi:choline monooxygenase|nr:SRPBCC family protein [Gemmataceae bacterium]
MSFKLHEKLALFDPHLPLERARTIPSSWYFDPEIYAAECRSVFQNTWQWLGRLDQLGETGSFFTMDLAGEPIMVVRDQEGKIRAFYNVCRHRAGRVVEQEQGRVSKLRCRYHGWTYDLAGRLRGTPEFEGVEDFFREDNGLVELEVDTWDGLVWVRQSAAQDGAKPLSLAEYLAPMPERTEKLNLGGLRFVERRHYDLACNWKVYVDNYLDGGYHVNTVHPGLAGVLDYSEYRTEIEGHTSVQHSPMKPPDAHADAVTGKVRSGDAAHYWWIFPNFMLNAYQGLMDVNLVLPLGPERCRVLFDLYFADTEATQARQFMADSIAVTHQVQMEDVGICEEVQRGLASRSYEAGRFSVRREIAGYHFHRLLARYLEAEANREAQAKGASGGQA